MLLKGELLLNKISDKDVEVIIRENTGLIRSIIKRHFPQFLNSPYYEDAIQEGAIGMLKAIEGFDESLGFQFSTYAYPIIRGSIKNNTKNYLPPVAVSRRSYEIYRTYKTLSEEGLTWEEVLKKLGIKDSTLRDSVNAYEYTSLDRAVVSDEEGKEMSLMDMLPTEDVDDDRYEIQVCSTLINLIPLRMADAFKLWMYGMSQKEIGEIIGISQAQVSRLLATVSNEYLPYFRQYTEGEIGYGELLIEIYKPKSKIKEYLKCYINFAIELSEEGHKVKGPLTKILKSVNLSNVYKFFYTPSTRYQKIPDDVLKIVEAMDRWCTSDYLEKVIECRVNNEEDDWLRELL